LDSKGLIALWREGLLARATVKTHSRWKKNNNQIRIPGGVVNIRPETLGDYEAITQVTLAAFTGKYSDSPTEHFIIKNLREAGALSLSLIAETDDQIVGHVAFSLVWINGEDLQWYGLGPVSVTPELQQRGIGSALIRTGLERLKALGARGCVLEGDFRYYRRFGFRTYPQLTYAGAPAPEYFMALPFYEKVPTGQVEFHPAFYTSPNG
jgi:putative acetyltransferase